MSTREERKDLLKNELPPEPVTLGGAVIDYVTNCPADRVLASIVMIDDEMEKIQTALKSYLTQLTMQRNALITRAREKNIMEDSMAYLVEKKGKQMRNQIEDLEAFELQFPEEYKQIRETQRKALDDDHTNAIARLEESKIPLTLADDKIGKKRVTEFVGYLPVTVSYEVQKKRGV